MPVMKLRSSLTLFEAANPAPQFAVELQCRSTGNFGSM